ncbi:hypothetical protein CcaCcLH18_08658 [Colletotrichum camelliae]|nr:hypothetical protein CcaCcLH18_08658 [Colletotrichum camelliae]
MSPGGSRATSSDPPASLPPPPQPPVRRTERPPVPPPSVPTKGPPGSFLVELLVFNGFPYKDHWTYWVNSHKRPDLGVLIHAEGSVISGFKFECKRNHDFRKTRREPLKRIPLQWVDGEHFDEKAMFADGLHKIDNTPVCGFERSARKAEPPGKSLQSTEQSARKAEPPEKSLPHAGDGDLSNEWIEYNRKEAASQGRPPPKVIKHRNCQTWIAESSDMLVDDGIFDQEVRDFLYKIKD